MRVNKILTAFLLAVALLVSGCGLMGGSAPASGSGEALVKVRISVLDLVDKVPMVLAVKEGLFRKRGLDVELTPSAKGSQSVDRVLSGDVQLGLTSYPPAITAHAKIAPLVVVVDAVTTRPNSVLVMIKKGAPIHDIKDLTGKKIANSSIKGISELAFNSHLRTHDIQPSQVTYVSFPIPDMPSKVMAGAVDAAIIAEPYIKLAYDQGLDKLYDPFSAQTEDFPWSGFIATRKWAEENKDTVQKIRDAAKEAAVLATQERGKTEKILVDDVKVDAKNAPLITIPVFPTTIDPHRLQRVVDLMRENGEKGANDKLIDVDMRTMMLDAA